MSAPDVIMPTAVPQQFPGVTMVQLHRRDDISRAGLHRETALLAVCNTLWILNHIEGTPTISLATSPATTAPFVTTNRGIPRAGVAATWNLAGQAIVPAFTKIVYLLLVRDTGIVPPGTPSPGVYPSVATGLNDFNQLWAPNGPEAFIEAINRDGGYTIVGHLRITNNTPNPWTPGTAFPAAPFVAEVFDGFPGDMLLPLARTNDQVVIMRR